MCVFFFFCVRSLMKLEPIYTYVYTRTYIDVYQHIHVFVCVRTYVCMYVCVRVRVCVNMYVLPHTKHIHTHYTHVYTFICRYLTPIHARILYCIYAWTDTSKDRYVDVAHGVATVRRIDEIINLFCRISCLL